MKPTVEMICSRVAAHYEVTVAEILGRDRHKSVREARHVAMWIARKRTALSYPELGREFRRDHSTVISAVRSIDRAQGPLLQTLRQLYAEILNTEVISVGPYPETSGAREIAWSAAE